MNFFDAFKISHSPAGILSSADGVFIAINAAFLEQFGYVGKQLIGRSPIEIGLWEDFDFRANAWAMLRNEKRIFNMLVGVRDVRGDICHYELIAEYIELNDKAELLFFLHPVVAQQSRDSTPKDDFYRSLYLGASEGLYRSFATGGFIDVNPALATIFGYESPDDMLRHLGDNMQSIYVHPELKPQLFAELERHGRAHNIRYQVYKKNRSVITISENVRNILSHEGRVLFQEGSIVDITQQVEAEEKLKQSQNLYQTLLDQSRDGVFLIQNGVLEFSNKSLSDSLGYGLDELVGMDYLNLVAPNDLNQQTVRKASREAGDRSIQSYEIQMQHRNGSFRLFEVRAAAVDYQGNISSTGTMRDITEERRYVSSLQDAERRYREVFENAPVGLFESDLNGVVLEANPALVKMLNYDNLQDFRQHIQYTTDVYVNLSDRELLVKLAIEQGGFDERKVQVRKKNGDIIWVSANVRLVRDAEQKPASFAGSLLDVNEREQFQAALIASENRYRMVVENSQIGVYILKDDHILFCNQTLLKLSGYQANEVIGRDVLNFVAPEFHELVLQRIATHKLKGELPKDLEILLLKKDGQRLSVQINTGEIVLDGETHSTGTVLDVTRQRDAERKLRFHATHDALTGLPNRMFFNLQLADRIKMIESTGEQLAVLFLDLDGFKWVNDSLGHSAGDRLLVEISRRLETRLRDKFLIARYGGDEFTMLALQPCDEKSIAKLATKILKIFELPFLVEGQQIYSRASIGIVLTHDACATPNQLIRDADTAMYKAKASGKSTFAMFDDDMHVQAMQRFELETDFRLALERSEFILHYQPILNLQTRQIMGAEALVRWQHPTRGLLMPGDFIALAEEIGLLSDLDRWVMREACHQSSKWRNHAVHLNDFFINVNADEKQITSVEMLDEVKMMLEGFKMLPHLLRLEINEKDFRAGRGKAESLLKKLKELGVGLVVDDFGTGYSSLESFAASTFDAFKIDQIFISDLESNSRHVAIVKTMIGFAKELGLQLTAEGIETQQQHELLVNLGCVMGQGFYFGRPVPPDEFEQTLYKKNSN
jgi:diguanylate cyclase (GGDEF)-like protein/PAS domain S-box-containing protein